MKVCACIEAMPTAAPMPSATCATEITRDIHHHCHQLVGQLMISSHSSGEQGRSQVKCHQLGALWRTMLEMCSDKLVKNTHTHFVSSKAEQGGRQSLVGDNRVLWQIAWDRSSARLLFFPDFIQFAFSASSSFDFA